MKGETTRLTQLLLLALVAVMLLGSGCAYFKDRFNDLTDIGGAKIVAGRGVRVAASINNEKSIGVGYFDYRKYGWDGRSLGVFADSGQEAVVMVEREFETICGTESAYCLEDVINSSNEEPTHILPPMTFRNVGDVQLTFVPVCLGLELNLNPVQFCDFVLGFLCIDAAGDDSFWKTKHPSWVDEDQAPSHGDDDDDDEE